MNKLQQIKEVIIAAAQGMGNSIVIDGTMSL